MSAEAALRRLLDKSGFIAVRVTPTAFRIEPKPRSIISARPRPVDGAIIPRAVPAIPPVDIVVTGQKRAQPLQDVPMSVAVIQLAGSQDGRLSPATRDLALSVEGLALTNLGSGRNRQFIRGVADSPFNGTSQTTVAVQLNEARVTFDAPDPDLRLIDFERVEILKGPQGPLYGAGALGGIYHLVTRQPDLTETSGSARLIAEAVEHGGLGVGIETVLNVPVVTDRFGLRGVGYVTREGGWIDNVSGRQNANSSRVDGGRLAARWQPDRDWSVNVLGTLQNTNVADSQYVTASDDTVIREARIAEPTDNDFKSIAATVRGRVGQLRLLVASSYVDHGVDYTLDASAAASSFGLTGPTSFFDDRKYTIVNHEVRLSPWRTSNWLVGGSYLRADSHDTATLTSKSTSIVAEQLNRRVTEIALFGEASVSIAPKLKATAGARLFQTIAEDEAVEQTVGRSDRITKTILSPSAALAWTPVTHNLVYARYARALRPGGLAAAAVAGAKRFDSDELGTVDIGYRGEPTAELSLNASVFYTEWSHIQSDYLLPNGLVSTRNAGKGRIFGFEAGAEWRPVDGLQLSAGGSYLSAKLVRTESGVEIDDRRLPVTPDATGRIAAQYRFGIGPWASAVSLQGNYIGRARLTFDENLDRRMGNYVTAATGAFFTRDRLTVGTRIDNVFDIKGDSFSFGNPFSIRSGSQYTPLRPRTFTFSIARAW